jgi:hypothetical protein
MNHFAFTTQESTIVLFGTGRVEFKYVNPADGPRNTKKSRWEHDQSCNFRARFEWPHLELRVLIWNTAVLFSIPLEPAWIPRIAKDSVFHGGTSQLAEKIVRRP